MSSSVADAPDAAVPDIDLRELTADLFHALNQPLTGLRCFLELAGLSQERPSALRLETAVAMAERAGRIAQYLRELVDAEYGGDHLELLNLTDYLREACTDFQPVAQAARVGFRFDPSDASSWVRFEAARLREALFHLLEFAFSQTTPGGNVVIAALSRRGTATLQLQISPGDLSPAALLERHDIEKKEKEDKEDELRQRWRLALCHRRFEAAGGGLVVTSQIGTLTITAHLPQAEPDAEGQGTSSSSFREASFSRFHQSR